MQLCGKCAIVLDNSLRSRLGTSIVVLLAASVVAVQASAVPCVTKTMWGIQLFTVMPTATGVLAQ